MPSFWDLARDTVVQIRADVAPGVSGWNHTVEEQELASLISDAQITAGMLDSRDAISVIVRERVHQRILWETPGAANRADSSRRWETEQGLSPGELNVALMNAEDYFIAEATETI